MTTRFSLGTEARSRRQNAYANDKYVTLLLHADKVNVNGEWHALDYSPLRLGHCTFYNCDVSAGGYFGNASMRFAGVGDGSGCYIYPPAHSGQDLSTADFTIDWWEYRSNNNNSVPTFSMTTSAITYTPMMVHSESGSRSLYFGNTTFTNWQLGPVTLGTIEVQTWTHLAIVRKGATVRTFKNGILQATATLPGAGLVGNYSSSIILGRWMLDGGAPAYYFYGHIDEFRISKGIARWTENFSVPIAPYGPTTFDDKTILLLHGDVSTGFADSSIHKHVPNVGSAAIQNGGWFGTGCMIFNADASSIVHYNYTEDFNFRAGDFSIDWWEYRYDGADGRSAIIRDYVNTYAAFLCGYQYQGNVYFYASSNGTNWDIMSNAFMGPLVIGQWVHRAMSRRGNTWRFFHNGVLQSAGESGGSLIANTNNLSIGNFAGSGLFYGAIDELRIVKGEARFIYNFTPPTAPYDPNVIPAPITDPPTTYFEVTVPASAQTNTYFNVTVQAKDAAGVNSTNYTGTVTFASIPVGLGGPGNVQLVNGKGTFSFSGATAGSFAVKATDTVNASITGTSGNVTITNVIPGSAVFYSSQWWTVPAGFNPNNNYCEVHGGGGGGAGGYYGNNLGGGGGGGGGYAQSHNMPLTAGMAVYIEIGAGGGAGAGQDSGGTPGTNGAAGGHSGILNQAQTAWHALAYGGGGGGSGANGGGGGAGGTAGVANYAGFSGGAGGGGGTNQGGSGGGCAGPSGGGSGPYPGGGFGGQGGAGGVTTNSGGSGAAYGGGGGGSGQFSPGVPGAGIQGIVRVTWN